MGCTYCGKEIGALRLLRDNEFCTSKHRKLYRDRLNRVLGEALTDGLPPGEVAEFITLLSPRVCLPHAFANLLPMGWTVGNEQAEWHFPLAIDPVAGKLPKRLPFKAVDRPAAPHMADQGAQTIEIATPVPPSMLPAGAPLPAAAPLPDLLRIPYPAMVAQSNWSVGLQAQPAIGQMLPAATASPSFSAAATRLPAQLTLQSNSPLALVIDGHAKILPQQAADRPAAARMDDREIALPNSPSVQLAASALPGIPNPAMAAPSNWSVELQAQPAMGTLLAAVSASPSFSATVPHLPACLTLESNSPLALVIDGHAKILPLQAADRPAAPRMDDREISSSVPPSLQLTASALPGIPQPAMAAPSNWSNGLQAQPAMGTLLAAVSASPSFSATAPHLPACLTLESNSPLALMIDGHAKILPLQAADRPAALRAGGQETAPSVSPSLQLTASALLGIPGSAMAAQANWSDGLQAQPAMGTLLPAVAESPSFSAAAPHVPACLTLQSNSPLALAIDGHAKILAFHPADRPAAPRMADREIAPSVSPALQLTASALPGIPHPAMAAQSWSDGLQAEPAMGKLFPAAAAPSFSAAALRLPECLTLCWDSPLVLGPVIDSRLQLLNFDAADRPAALCAAVLEMAPIRPLRFAASALPGIPGPAIAALANWSDGRRAEPALGEMGLAGAAAPSFSAAAPRLPECLTLEPVQAFQSNEPPQEAGFISLDYHCAAAISGPSVTLEWKWRSPVCALLPFGLQIAAEKLETPAAVNVKKPVAPFLVPAAAVAKKAKWQGRAMQMAAAAVLLVVLTGFGVRFAAGIATETPDVKSDAVASSSEPSVKSGGAIENIRRVIADRAKVELNDTFEKGMEAWGHTASWAPGWSHHSEGYVQTGQMAFYQPSMKFTDYRMEFFGQIESKSIGWVVRAHDPKNYYAMKFTVIQSGLRPIIAMVHYPVTDGHPGKPVETPLMDVMVHNNTPYHVAVTVAGNRIITSIEGQEVDRWIEDQIPSGGVGFYSDAGERARLYWMKVSKNEDFLGKVCAYLSGSADSSRVFASLLPPTTLLPPTRWNYDRR